MYELKHLRAFIVLAEELHFKRAAERLHLTQPPLSQRLKQLETSLGVSLIKRTTRTVELTDAGKVLAVSARSLLNSIETMDQEVKLAATGNVGHLTIGFVPSAAYVLLPKILRKYKKLYPKVDIQLEEMPYIRILENLKRGAIDVAFLRTSTKEKAIESYVALKEPLMFAIPKSHRLAKFREVSIPDVDGEDFIAFSIQDSPYFSEKIQDLLLSHDTRPRIVQYSLLPTILSFVEASIGVAIVPQSVSRIGSPNITYKPIHGARNEANVELTAAWNKSNNSILMKNLIKIIKG